MERIKKEHKDKIMNIIEKAGDEEYVTSWDDRGIPVSKKKSEIKKGKKSRAAGSRFELKVRHNLEEMGWIVARWTNNIEFYEENEAKL